MKDKDIKKNLKYLSGEDFYVFCYSILIVLDYLKCKNGQYFKDYRKIPFLVDFIKDEKLNYIILNSGDKDLNPIDKEYLFSSYSAGLSRRSEILKLLFTLEKRKYVFLEKTGKQNIINVSLNEGVIPADFFDKDFFFNEYKNIKNFSLHIKRLRILTLNTMLERIYEQNGISIWAI
ncbi:MAG: hypothetical protein D3917_02985 [Candidatus Electrothrix sp. AX5]|nr:hypothetical protein [Candidatus Electrothrix sp. AX5]